MITLYQQQDSGNCYKVRLLLAHLRLPFETVAVSSLDGSTRRPEFLAKNPIGKVPTVRLDDGRYLAESNAILLHFAVVGFTLDKDKQQPNVITEVSVLDESGKPVLAKPFSGTTTEVGNQFKKILPMDFPVQLNRSGKFKVQIKVTDKLANKTAETALDLTVVEQK